MLPTEPSFMETPFAANGNKNTIPASNDGTDGLASLALGFPQITETPLKSGGLPPTRKDFNGILNWLSAFSFFAQSGGLFTYNAEADYNSPAVVYYNNMLWYCVKQNGPSTTAGAVTPGDNSSYWVTLIEFLMGNAKSAGVGGLSGVPVGTVIMWASNNDPDDSYGVWIDCDGRSISNYPDLVAVLGQSTAPNYSGLFPRCIGSYTETNSTYGTVVHSAPSLNSVQTDAIRNITGRFAGNTNDDINSGTSAAKAELTNGCFYISVYNQALGADGGHYGGYISFNASRSVPTATENRPVNIGVRFLIKASD